jgi:hypothetical protein
LGLADNIVERFASIDRSLPLITLSGQLVISGIAVEKETCEAMKAAETKLYCYRLVVHSTLNDGTSREG